MTHLGESKFFRGLGRDYSAVVKGMRLPIALIDCYCRQNDNSKQAADVSAGSPCTLCVGLFFPRPPANAAPFHFLSFFDVAPSPVVSFLRLGFTIENIDGGCSLPDWLPASDRSSASSVLIAGTLGGLCQTYTTSLKNLHFLTLQLQLGENFD